MPVIARKASELPKTNVLPEMTVRVRVNKCEYRNVDELKAAGKIKADSELSDGLNLDLVIIDEGEYFGRHVFDGVDLDGQYAYRSRNFLDAVEYPSDENIDTDALAEATFTAVIGIQKESADGQYPEKNRVKKFMKG